MAHFSLQKMSDFAADDDDDTEKHRIISISISAAARAALEMGTRESTKWMLVHVETTEEAALVLACRIASMRWPAPVLAEDLL